MDSDSFLFDLPDLRHTDFTAHNEASRALWAAFAGNTHARPPVRFNTNPRVLLLNPAHNVRGISYAQYMTDPEMMGQVQLEWQYWMRFLLPGDHEKGLPERWTVHVDFQNIYDAAWLGCPVAYREEQVPDTEPILREGRENLLFDRGIPGPFEGEWAERCLALHDALQARAQAGWTFLGRPVEVGQVLPMMNCDGVFTVAANVRGASEICTDLLDQPEYAETLLGFLCEALLQRVAAWRERFGLPVPTDGYCGADDCIELLSTDQYRTHILPLHRRQYDRLATHTDRAIHLCGDAQRHFPIIRDELGVTSFDTGFPVDFAQFRSEMGPDILISGGPAASYFVRGDVPAIVAETERILSSGVLEGGRFILQEGNNLPPHSSLACCQAVYDAGQRARIPVTS